MTLDDWTAQWHRLDHFHIRGDADRDSLSAEWFRQLQHHHVDAVDAGITQLIGKAEDTFLPGLGLLKSFIQARIDRYDRAPGKCATCHGSTWIEVAPWKSYGIVYEGVRRCPDCGVPAPQGDDRAVMEPLSALELHEYQAGRYNRDLMPAFAQAKPVSEEKRLAAREDFRQWSEKLCVKLFGVTEAKAS